MFENVRIGYEIDVAGISDFKSLTDAIRAAVEQQQRFEQQSNQAGQSAEKASALIGQLVGFYDKLKAAGNSPATVLPTEQLEQGKKLLGDLLGQLESIRKESFAPTFDDTGLNKGQASAEKLKKQFADLAAEIDKLNTKSVLNVVPDKGIASGVRGLQLNEQISSFASVVPDHERDQLSERVTQVVQRDVFAEQLKSANAGPEAGLAEAQAREQGGEQAVLALRQKNLEAIRAEALAKAPVLEEQNLINAAVDRQIKLESNTSALKERLRDEQELLTAKERVAKLVEETNARELSGTERLNAERKRTLELHGKTPELRSQINTAFDRQIKNQAAPRLATETLQNAIIATQSPVYAAANALGDFSTKLGPIGLSAAVAAVAIAGIAKGMYSLVENEGKAAEGLQNFASRLGITVNQASQLSAEAAVAGVNISSLEGAARYLSQALEDPAGAGKKSATALRDMGVAAYTATGQERELGDVTLDVIDKLSQYPTAAERAFHAAQVLGRGGAKELQPLIEQHQELKQLAQDLGYTNVEELTKKLGDADDQIDKLTLAWQLFRKELAGTIAPVVIPVVTDLTNFFTPGRPSVAGALWNPAKEALRLFNPDLVAKAEGRDFTKDANDLIGETLRDKRPKSPDDPRLKAEATADAERERKALLSTRDGLEARKAELSKEIQTSESKLTSPDVTFGRDELHATVSKDRTELAQIEAKLKRLSGSDKTANRYQAELDRIKAELVKAEHPASQFGRAPEIQAQLESQLDSYRRDKNLTPTERTDLIQKRTAAGQKAVAEANSEFAGTQAFKGFQETRINTDAGLESTRLQQQTAQRLAQINSPEKDETVEAVNQAYQKQLDLAKQIHDAHLADLATLKEQLAAAGDHSRDAEVKKSEADENRKYDEARAKADSERLIRTAEINKRERDEARRTAEEIGHIREEAQLRSLELESDHRLRLADTNRPDTVSPVADIENAYQTQLQLAQLEHDFAVQQNADIFKDDEGKRKIADERARQELIERGQQAEYEREERIADLRKQERDYAKDQAASLYDALKQGPKGIREFFQQQADQVGRNLFAELFGPAIQKLDQTINPSGGGIIGAATRGTIFGASNGSSQQPGQPNAQQQQPGFLGKLQQSLGIKPPPQPINAPSLGTSTEPLIGSLERNKGSIDALTAAILNITPGGGVGPNPLANPLGGAAVPKLGPAAGTGLSELGITSLIRTNQQTANAVHVLAETHQQSKPPLNSLAQFHTVDELATNSAEPITVPENGEEEATDQPITAPVFSPVIHAPRQATPHISVAAPHVNVAPAAVTLPETPQPINVPETNALESARLVSPAPAGSSVSNAYTDNSVHAPVSNSSQSSHPSQAQPSPALEDFPSKEPSVSPHGFPVLGEVASSDPGSLTGLFTEAAKAAVDAINPIPAIKRYAYDIPSEELGKAGDAYKNGNLLESAGHVIASIPGTGLVSDTLTAQAQLGQRAAKEFQEGKYSDALAHELNAVVPFIGPQSAAMADKLRSGDPKQIAQAVGEFGGVAASGTLPLHKLPEAASELSDLAKAAGEHPIVKALKDETGSFGPGSGFKRSMADDVAEDPEAISRRSRVKPLIVYRGEDGSNARVADGTNHVFVTTDPAIAAAHGKVSKYRLKEGTRVYPDPEAEGFRGEPLTGIESLLDEKSAVVHSQDLVSLNAPKPRKSSTSRAMDALKDATGSFGPGSGRKVEQSLIDKYVQDSHSLSETEQQRLAEAVRTKTPKAKSVIRIMPEDPGWTPSHTVSFDQPKSTSSAVQDVLAGKPIGHISWKGSDGALVLIENPKTGLDVDYSKTNTPDFSAAGEKETIVAGKYYVHERREVPEPGTREEDGYKVPMYVLREHAQPTEYNLPTLEQTVGETGSSLLDDAKTADQSLATGTPKKSPHGFATLGEVSSIGSPDGLFTAHEPEPVPAQSSAPPIAPVQPPPVPQQPIRPIAPVTATAPSYQPSLSSASIGVSPGIGSSIYDAPPGALPTGTPGVFRIPGFAGDIYVDRYGRPLSGAGTAPQQVPQPAPGQFAQHHPTLAKTGDTASQLLVASLPGAVTRNPATIATSAYSDLGILLHALDTRKPSKSGPDSRGGTVLNGVEQLFGVATPQQRYQQKSNPLGGIPPIFRTPPFLPNGTTAFGSSPSGHGQLPTQTGQSLPGTDANAGTILTKTESGLILRQPQGSVLNNAPDISPLPQSVPNPIDVLGTPTPPPYTENPFEIPHAPPFEDHLPASADPNVQLADPNANADAAHTAILNNGLSQTAPFNSGGAEILPLSVLDAANPFHRPGSAFKAIQNAGQAALSGFMAGGIGSGTGHPAGYQTESTISFGDGSSQSFTGGGLFGDSGSSGIGQIFDGTDPSILGPNTPVPWEDSSGPNLGPASKLGLGTFLGPGLGIFSGLKQGGTKGHLSAASSGLALAAQLDPEPISKTILGLAAGISGVLHAIMGDPRAKRQEQLTKEIEGEKIRAFDFTQPGITLNESAAGGHAVSEAFNGALQVSAGRPVVYNRNEAVGFDPIHQDRVVTRAIRQVTTIGDVHGNSPSTIIPTTPATALLGNSRPYQTGLPVSSADLTTPQLPLSSTDLTPNPVQSEAAANPLAALAALQSQITNHYGGNQISVQVPPHLFNAAVMQQYANSIADVIDQKLRTSTHPLNQTIRDTVRTS